MQVTIRLVFSLFIGLSLISVSGIAQAQETEEDWSPPVNLSQSGAASQPRLVSHSAGQLQAFWWDSFDGLVTSIIDTTDESGLVWGDPVLSPINSDELESTPVIVADTRGWVHAFWLESGEGGETPLMYSLLTSAFATWTAPVMLSSSALTFDVAIAPSGEISLAYIRNTQTPEIPAGVYVAQFDREDPEWSSPFPVYSSIYYRLLPPEEAYVDLEYLVDAEGNLLLYTIWEDARQGLAYVVKSVDFGDSWGEALALGTSEDRPSHPVIAGSPDSKAIVIWRSALEGGCSLYQQEATISATVTVDSWSVPQPVLQDLVDCPQAGYFWTGDDHLYWLWGEGTSNLTIAGWDPAQRIWSQPHSFTFRFEDADEGQSVSMGDLHSTIFGEALAVVGSDDSNGEVWFTQAGLDIFEIVFSPPPPWSAMQRLTGEGVIPGYPAIAADNDGHVHMVWSQAASPEAPGTSLYYGRSFAGALYTLEILNGEQDEVIQQPGMVYDPDADGLHLVWSGGNDGSIFYSWASAADVGTTGAWLPPKKITPHTAASFPQIGLDATGNLSVLYVVSLNEGRGVFLVRSQDGGSSWSEPIQVFDAVAEGWAMVNHPALTVSPTGELHAAWVQGELPGFGLPLGIFYSYSIDGGEDWSEPLLLAGNGNDWPRLALSGDQIHILFAELVNEGGELHHRWTTQGQQSQSSNWSLDASIPNWQDIALPFGLASDEKGEIHLVGVDRQQGILRYTAWEAVALSGGRWSPQEIQDETDLISSGLGANAAASSLSGKLAVVSQSITQGDESGMLALYYTARQIEVGSLETPANTIPTPQPTSTPTLVPSPTAEPIQLPTITPDLNTKPEEEGNSIPPLILGGVVAAVILIGIFAIRELLGRVRG